MRLFGEECNYTVLDEKIIEILLQDRTMLTKFPINPEEVLPRYLKSSNDKKSRTKKKAEVFTPSKIVKKMNDMLENGYEGTIEEFIKRKVLEVTCGEAPFLTTRYEPETGVFISVKDRTGLLDRKLQCIPGIEYGIDIDGYIECVSEALKSVYGYEWQFDSLFLARLNLLLTVIEHYVDRYNLEPEYKLVSQWAMIISYNIIRMDGITLCVPETKIPAKIMNWDTGQMEHFDG